MKKIISLFFLLSVSSAVYSQSLGITIESFPVNILQLGENGYYYGSVKNVMFNFDIHLKDSFHLLTSLGYGWDSYSSNLEYRQLPFGQTQKDNYEYKTGGIPVEVELAYRHYISRDSTFEPLIGLGIGFYSYKTEHKQNNDINYKTYGFTQFASIGMNIHFSKRMYCSVEMKKIFMHSLTTKRESKSSSSYSLIEADVIAKPGLDGMSASFGVSYKL